MGYLLPTEYVQYGLTAETTDDWVTMASALIEAHCRRPSLQVTQYVERLRVMTGSQTVRLSYLPLADGLPDSGLVSVRARYGRPRRGELADIFREQVAWAFTVPGSWATLSRGGCRRPCVDGRVDASEQFPGAELQRGRSDVYGGGGDGSAGSKGGVRADCA